MNYKLSKFIVTPRAKRPASKEDKCFYCNQAIGDLHKIDCVLINQKVKVKETITFTREVDVPTFFENYCRISGTNPYEGALNNKCTYCPFNYLEDNEPPCKEYDDLNCHTGFIEKIGEPFLNE